MTSSSGGDNNAPNKNAAVDGYEVGYGKPPKANQFKPGQSGNTKGRPKRRPSLHAVASKALNRRIKIRKDGKECHATVYEALIYKQIELGMRGNPRALKAILDLVESGAADEPILIGSDTLDLSCLSTDEVVELRRICRKAGTLGRKGA